jgi:hypothetical protein
MNVDKLTVKAGSFDRSFAGVCGFRTRFDYRSHT